MNVARTTHGLVEDVNIGRVTLSMAGLSNPYNNVPNSTPPSVYTEMGEKYTILLATTCTCSSLINW